MQINIIIKIVKGAARVSADLPSIPPSRIMGRRSANRQSGKAILNTMRKEYGV